MDFEEYIKKLKRFAELSQGDKEDRLTNCVKHVFSTREGKELLEELKEAFLLEPVARPGADISYAYYREGQNDLIRMFITVIEAKNE